MDIDALLHSVIRFSNFMTSRLIVAGVFFYVMTGFTDIGSTAEGFLPDMELINQVVANYQTIFDLLGVSDFALLFILFVFLTTIHIVHVGFDRVGAYLPPGIIPLRGWDAIEDLIHPAFEILRDARGTEHSEEENQRLYEFDKKLREIDAANEAAYREELEGVSTAFRIAKSFILFSLTVWIYAALTGAYRGDMILLLVILATSLLVALYAAFRIFRAHGLRIADLRQEVSSQFIGFARIWTPLDHQERVLRACVASKRLKSATFAVLVPVFGTLDSLAGEWRGWTRNRARRTGADR